jgi:hypothetical protein
MFFVFLTSGLDYDEGVVQRSEETFDQRESLDYQGHCPHLQSYQLSHLSIADDDLTEVPLGHPDLDDQNDEDELHVTAAPSSRYHTEPASELFCRFCVRSRLNPLSDLSLAPSSSVQPATDEGDPRYYEDAWDDDLAEEGDRDASWNVEHETESNESSITLSSKASSKRTYDEVDDAGDAVAYEPLPSPGMSSVNVTLFSNSRIHPEPKRPRVQ